MDIQQLFAAVPVADYTAALAWYERLMGRPPDFHPNEQEAVWQMVENGWFYIVANPPRAGKSLVTFMVDDLDRLVAELEGRGVAGGPIDTQPGLYRMTEIPDLDGNLVRFGQALGTD